MQDAMYLPHKWDGEKIVPRIDESFRQSAQTATFSVDTQPGPVQNSRGLLIWGVVAFAIGAIILVLKRSTK